jgi:hypothetical protein
MMYSAKTSLAADAPPNHESVRALPPARLPSFTHADARAAAKIVMGSGSGSAHGFGTLPNMVKYVLGKTED